MCGFDLWVSNCETIVLYLLFLRGGNGLDWFSSIRCAQPLKQTKQIKSLSKVNSNESRASDTAQGNIWLIPEISKAHTSSYIIIGSNGDVTVLELLRNLNWNILVNSGTDYRRSRKDTASGITIWNSGFYQSLGINFREKYGTKEKRYKVDLNKS